MTMLDGLNASLSRTGKHKSCSVGSIRLPLPNLGDDIRHLSRETGAVTPCKPAFADDGEMMFRLLARLCTIALLSVATPKIAAAQILPEGGMSIDQLVNIALNHPYAQSQPACQRYRAADQQFERECVAVRPQNRNVPYCQGLISQKSSIFSQCMDVIYAEDERQKGANANAGGSQQTAAVGQCVSFEKVQERDSFGNPSCGIRAENNCSVATECQLEMTGVDSQGRRHPSRQAIHLQPGQSGARTINNVLACENLQGQCKAWKQ
jgi:hypothetical protein